MYKKTVSMKNATTSKQMKIFGSEVDTFLKPISKLC